MEQIKGKLYLCGAFSLAGTSVIAARFVIGHLGTFTITASSLFLAFLALFFKCRKDLIKTVRQMACPDWALLLCQALCGIVLFRMFLIWGLSVTSAVEAGILTGLTPAFTTLFAWLFLKESINREQFSGIICAITGILFIEGLMIPGNAFVQKHFYGNMLVLCAALCESVFNICSRIHSLKKRSNHQTQVFDSMVQTTLVIGIALFFCLIPVCFEHPLFSLNSISSIQVWLALGWYGLFVTALAFIFWYDGIKRCKASTAAVYSGLMPFSAIIFSAFILKENVGWQQWCGGLLVVFGMILSGKTKQK